MSIFEFSNYRDYLRAFVRTRGRSGHGELSRIAKHLRISPTLLSQILSGQRDFNTDHACELAEYLQLTEIEADFLYLLVEQERAGTHRNKAYLKKKIAQKREDAQKLSTRVPHEKVLSETERSVFYSSWIYAAVHLFLGSEKDGVTLEQICARFDLDRKRAMELMQFFLHTDLAREEHGKFLPGVQSTFVEQGSPHLLRHHANWRIKAIQRSENLTTEELMFTAPVSISPKDFAIVRARAAQFIQEISELVKASGSDEIAHLNLDWFRIEK